MGADGRHAKIRREAGFVPQDFGAPMDVLWLRVPRLPGEPPDRFGLVDRRRVRPELP